MAPGFTPSPRVKKMFDHKTMDRMIGDQAIGRQQQTDDIVGAIVFLASPASSFVTGQVIHVDGGASMR